LIQVEPIGLSGFLHAVIAFIQGESKGKPYITFLESNDEYTGVDLAELYHQTSHFEITQQTLGCIGARISYCLEKGYLNWKSTRDVGRKSNQACMEAGEQIWKEIQVR
jgi:hypothetical protein